MIHNYTLSCMKYGSIVKKCDLNMPRWKLNISLHVGDKFICKLSLQVENFVQNIKSLQ